MADSIDWLVHPQDFLKSGTMPTVPETPGTMDVQFQQLLDRKRDVLMVPKGTGRPKGANSIKDAAFKTINIPKSGIFIFNSEKIGPREIRQAIKDNKLTDILGAADGGMGAPDKTAIKDEPVAVVGTTPKGVTTQGTVTDMPHLKKTLKQTRKLTPAYGSVKVTSPQDEILNRILYRGRV